MTFAQAAAYCEGLGKGLAVFPDIDAWRAVTAVASKQFELNQIETRRRRKKMLLSN